VASITFRATLPYGYIRNSPYFCTIPWGTWDVVTDVHFQ
jgi:hypothetical protein